MLKSPLTKAHNPPKFFFNVSHAYPFWFHESHHRTNMKTVYIIITCGEFSNLYLDHLKQFTRYY